MEPESIIYTDGHEVKVTSSKLIVGKREYLLAGVTGFQLHTVRANKLVPLFLLLLGVAGIIAGLAHVFPVDSSASLNAAGHQLDSNNLAVIIGSVLAVIGLIWVIAVHDRYAVHITTAEGEKNVIVSPKRDYVDQIVAALRVALTPSF